MCGIFGVVAGHSSPLTDQQLKKTISGLFLLSESRGREAAGLALRVRESIRVLKEPHSASRMLQGEAYKNLFREGTALSENGHFSFIGQARLVTNGALEENANNQPVIKDGIVGVHNGIVVNDERLWRDFPDMNREQEVDTEVILSLIGKFITEGKNLEKAIKRVFDLIKGEASVALMFDRYNTLALATNTGSLYYLQNFAKSVFVFASELYIIKTLLQKYGLDSLLGEYEIGQVKPNTSKIINLKDLSAQDFSLNRDVDEITTVEAAKPVEIIDVSKQYQSKTDKVTQDISLQRFEKFFSERQGLVDSRKRCTNCILPRTMPFIQYDSKGVCNYCRNYKRMKVLGEDELRKALEPHRRRDSRPDCLITFSGGRDSSYALHYFKKVLGMNPIAYSYDWGMLTDLGRRNQARMCGKLGVEHIWVSADIRKKRENIRRNVLAWLKKSDLGTVPLFMAGDKQFFYYANRLKQQNGLDLIVFAENPMEKTYFKSGFTGIKPHFESVNIHALGLADKFRLASYYGKQYLSNPSYINSSLIDTLGAYASYYLIPHNYLYFFNYIKWDEEEIMNTLISEYDWEIAKDTKTTWRIGDGTAAFYNYIYYTVAGFTENDTFRSNQIREGILSRDKALALAKVDNQARWESLKWYGDIIGIELNEALEVISKMSKLY